MLKTWGPAPSTTERDRVAKEVAAAREVCQKLTDAIMMYQKCFKTFKGTNRTALRREKLYISITLKKLIRKLQYKHAIFYGCQDEQTK
jgi:hypothetical protein